MWLRLIISLSTVARRMLTKEAAIFVPIVVPCVKIIFSDTMERVSV